jgi:geranylgeranyl reductase family protein
MNAESEYVPWQQASETVAEQLWDVLVIGAGPAGSVAALHLATQGHRVLLLDKKHFPRDKACGDGLLSDAQGVLDRAGLLGRALELGHQVETLSVFSPSGIECQIRGRYLVVRRRLLDALLARKAVEAGAIFCHGDAARVVEEDNGLVTCSLKGSGRSYRARAGVIATGASVDLLWKLGLVTRRDASGAAVRCYVRSALDLSRLVVAYDHRTLPGYSWIFPMRGQEYNVGCARFYRNGRREPVNLRRMFQQFTTHSPLARALLQKGEIVSPLQGALVRCGLHGVASAGAHLLAIGETVGTTYPSTGEGIGKAMETGELAAEMIHEALRSTNGEQTLRGFPARLEERWRRKYRGYEIAARWLSNRWLNDLVAWRARQSPFFLKAVMDVMSDASDPRSVFSVGSILKSFWR